MKILILGSGIAGLSAAIHANDKGHEVLLMTKTNTARQSNTAWAQGGIVYKGKEDKKKLLYDDIMAAGDGLCNPKALEILVREGPRRLKELLLDKIQVPFNKDHQGKFILTQEGAHSVKRILFSHDQSGKAIVDAMIDYVESETNIEIQTSRMAVDLITMPHHSSDPMAIYQSSICLGAYVLNTEMNQVETVFADKVILATGGIGQIFRHTTNPAMATGDGIALAYRAGARIGNMQYTQFHPTSLAVKESDNFLISEALRGEGAILINSHGKDFTKKYDKRGSLAPRDIVSRAIIDELEISGEEYVFLTCEKIKNRNLKDRFPTIYQYCYKHKIDIETEPIPVVPAFHFICGGIITNTHGQSTIPNLYAVGESACTGVHGANRLASTSLLEGLVFAHRAVSHMHKKRSDNHFKNIRDWEDKGLTEKVDPILVKQDLNTLKFTMWNYVGIIRKNERMQRAMEIMKNLVTQVDHFYRNAKLNRSLVELRNAVQVGQLVTTAAMKNKTSRGCHYVENP